MTPKDKAFELVTKYSRILPMNQTTLLDHKNCALVAANEVLDHVDMVRDEAAIPYWQQVKQEINNL
jgi:hypothetical protein